MTIRNSAAHILKGYVADFANASAALRALESDELWCEAEGRTPGPNLLDQLAEARHDWRKAHKQVYGFIDSLTEEKP
ncbi:hypothetical protein [Nesterenkonia sp. PF2B19]|uniref:hypothetical protein n=1 Tax=Nesterenkonia sp. PF2B19 TaxID=1881858 RepID=UPI000871C32E|nr:hypothetical protein [Nesterenkonia sp. PF2B19]OSM43494.1 hypothetical protein BCY76_008220 [Nesterenkonia sp. PF2B19]